MVGDDDSVRAARRRFARVVGIEDALDDQRSLPRGAHPFDVLPGDARIEVTADPAHEVAHRRARAEQRLKVAECHRPSAKRHVPRPIGATEHLARAAQRSAHRSRNSRPIIAVARAGHRQIDGEQDRAAAGLFRTRNHVADEPAVLDDIQLKPGRAGAFGHLLDRAGAESRERKGHAGSRGRARRLDFAAPGIEAGEPDRAQTGRHRPALSEQFGRKVDRRDVAQHALPQRDRLQVLDVPPQRHFVVRAAVEIFEQEMRQPRFRKRAVIADAGRLHVSSPRFRGEGDQRSWWRGSSDVTKNPSTAFGGPPPLQKQGRIIMSQTPGRGGRPCA